MSKLEFTAIMYGDDKEGLNLLTKIATQMRGNVKGVIEPSALQGALTSLIAEVYEN